MVNGLSCPAEIFPDQGSNPSPLHCQMNSQPLDHQGSPQSQSLGIPWSTGWRKITQPGSREVKCRQKTWAEISKVFKDVSKNQEGTGELVSSAQCWMFQDAIASNKNFYLLPIIMSVCMRVSVTQSCLTLCDPMDCSPPGFSVHGILQSRILEWVTIPFSRGSSWPRNWTQVSCIAGRLFAIWATREAQ